MPTKFSYFPAYGKGLPSCCRLWSTASNSKGNPVGMSKWPELKATGAFPFGQLPVLETEDAGVIGQSTACLHYIAKTKNAGGGPDGDVEERHACGDVGRHLCGHHQVQPR